MMKIILPALLILCLTGCNRTVLSSCFMGKMTDRYFKLKKNGQIVAYERILGLTKIGKVTGHYTTVNDTLYLSYPGDSTPEGLGERAYIDKTKKELIFLGVHGYPYRYDILFDRRRVVRP
ncbi:MAG TPA: hypothetical protein VI233_14900 [Puia sp.]